MSTPLIKKLGLKPEMVCFFHQVPKNYFLNLNLPKKSISIVNIEHNAIDFVHIFETNGEPLMHILSSVINTLDKSGIVWISWPKKTSEINSDIDKWSVMKIGQEAGLVDVKVASYDEDWSCLKFVYRLKDR